MYAAPERKFESLVNSSSGKTKNHYSCDCDCLRALLIQVVVKQYRWARAICECLRALLIQVVVKPFTIFHKHKFRLRALLIQVVVKLLLFRGFENIV